MVHCRRILLVDDNSHNLFLLKTIIESFGHETELASDGTIGLQMLNSGIDLVVADVLMPNLNGYELCRAIRRDPQFKDLPVVLITVLDDKQSRTCAVESGADDFITKPFNRLELQVRIKSLLRMKEAQDAIKRNSEQLELEIARRTAELKDTQNRLQYVFENTLDLIFIKDKNMRYTYVNPAMLAKLEMDSANILGAQDKDFPSANWSQNTQNLDQRVLLGQELESEYSIVCQGESLFFNCIRFPLRDISGEIIGLCGIARDITDRRIAINSRPQITIDSTHTSPIQSTYDMVSRAAKTDSLVLFTGETGSGKDYFAEYLHLNSTRAGGPFFAVNCAAIASEVAESELFGHESGSFTGARGRKRGLLELAEGGTLLLNEIGELSLNLQAKLLTFLDSRSFTRVGGTTKIEVNARIISATNKDLTQEVQDGRFRRDLYHRLNVISIRIPPLRERIDELLELIDAILKRLCLKLAITKVPAVHPTCISLMSKYHWPGNIRELKNVLERSLIISDSKDIRPSSIRLWDNREITCDQDDWFHIVHFPSEFQNFNDVLRTVKTNLIEEALRRSSGVKKQAANLLGVSLDSFKYHAKLLEKDL